jgi:anti-sigma B factor antagonist|tara:strand:+ start:1766 stop:2113 length:348 start_codon:yes stop_codon:yes gene_type:complete
LLAEIRRSVRNQWVVLAMTGELDLGTSPMLRQAVVAEVADGHNHLVIDMSRVDFIDSAGLGSIIGALRRVRSHDGHLLLVCSQQQVRRAFEMCDLDRVFTFHVDVDSAVGTPVQV